MTISFKDRVAIVTGAGGGLGRSYALELAKRGAKVVVNDLGGSRDGTGHSDAALKVVEEIKAMGGEAMSNGGSVTEYAQMEEMVAKAKEAWGGVHILINNAGILRDKSFAKMTMEDWKLVVDVHLNGSANCTKAVWDLMRASKINAITKTSIVKPLARPHISNNNSIGVNSQTHTKCWYTFFTNFTIELI